MNKQFIRGLLVGLMSFFFIAAVGDVFKSVMVNSSGVIQNSPLSYSNQFQIYRAATNLNQLVRYQEFTNALANATPVGYANLSSNNVFHGDLIQKFTNSGGGHVYIDLTDSANDTLYEQVGGFGLGKVALRSSGGDFFGSTQNIAQVELGTARAISYDTMTGLMSINPDVISWLLGTAANRIDAQTPATMQWIGTTNYLFPNTSRFNGGSILFPSSTTVAVSNFTLISSIGGTVTTSNLNLTAGGVVKYAGVTAFTGSVTNNGNGSTNITVYADGIVTNNFRTP